MNAALLLSGLLIWVMSCAICMALFTTAKRCSDPRFIEVREHSPTGNPWLVIFVLSFLAWTVTRIWMAQ